jgi:WD40 repeat protein
VRSLFGPSKNLIQKIDPYFIDSKDTRFDGCPNFIRQKYHSKLLCVLFKIKLTFYFSIQGVIFSLSWDEALSRLFSSSDDRSVRIWRVSLNDGDWAKAEITSEHELYGHVARVWRALPSSGLLVTAGEDSQLVQWDVEQGCEVARHENVHQGGNIWSLDIDPQRQLIVSGSL